MPSKPRDRNHLLFKDKVKSRYPDAVCHKDVIIDGHIQQMVVAIRGKESVIGKSSLDAWRNTFIKYCQKDAPKLDVWQKLHLELKELGIKNPTYAIAHLKLHYKISRLTHQNQ